MPSLKTVILLSAAAIYFIPSARLQAQPEGVVSSAQHDGVMVTSISQPEFFIFRSGNSEEHFDGTSTTMVAQGGFEKGEPITGLHYMRPRLTVNGPPWSAEDAKLLAAQFHGGPTGDYYLFKTVEGRLFYLPKEGEIPVVRVDYLLRDGRTITVWMRK